VVALAFRHELHQLFAKGQRHKAAESDGWGGECDHPGTAFTAAVVQGLPAPYRVSPSGRLKVRPLWVKLARDKAELLCGREDQAADRKLPG